MPPHCASTPERTAPPGLRLSEVIRAGLSAYAHTRRLPLRHWKILNALQQCHTFARGAHRYACRHCQQQHVAPHACGNRHCPDCQGINSRRWLDAQQHLLLQVPYFHLVFTLPHPLNPLIQQNQAALYKLLFDSASATLLQFGRQNLGAHLGITAVLHTWSQTLLDHYHLHCIVTGGGPALDGQSWVHSGADYLFNVQALGQVFRGKFCAGLEQLYRDDHLDFYGQLTPLGQAPQFFRLLRQVRSKGWVVYCKRPFAGPQQVLAYLSRYTHRVGITNRRLLQLDQNSGAVTFAYKDYADGARHKTMTLNLEEFIRRLCLHFLPPHFVKIRHYGLLANRGRQPRLARARALLGMTEPVPAPPRVESPPRCPHCGSTDLDLIEIIKPRRPDPPPEPIDTS